MIGDFLQEYEYAWLVNYALSFVDDTLDKRQGSIIFDTTSPNSYVVAFFFLQLRQYYSDTFLSTATGDALDRKAEEFGLTRRQATYAVKRCDFYDRNDNLVDVPLGTTRVATRTTAPINYFAEEQYSSGGTPLVGVYRMRCEVAGTIGNEYTGECIQISNVPGIARIIMSDTLVPAQDTETDDEFRQRIINSVNYQAFGGNVQDYVDLALGIDGVGSVQVYPVWDGGGTVKLSILDPSYQPISEDFQDELLALIDPENYVGERGTGLGLAPIDHKVTIDTATELVINVNASVSIEVGYTLSQLQPSIEEAIETYLASIRQDWGNRDEYNRYILGVYRALITSRILGVTGITNVTDVTINGADADIQLTETSTLQQLPVLGTVTINEL